MAQPEPRLEQRETPSAGAEGIQEPRALRFEGYVGLATPELIALVRAERLADEIRRLIDPRSATATLHWGRNYLYRASLDTVTGPVEVAIKQFRNQSLKARWRRRRRGSKAARSFAVARELARLGVPTPEPLFVVESVAPDGPSFYGCRHLEDGLEARYPLRALNAGTQAEQFPHLDVEALLEALGRLARRLHDGGVWYRDLTAGNVLLSRQAAVARPDLYLVDLNRARVGRRLSLSERARDLGRMPILARAHQERYLAGYAAGGAAPLPQTRLWLLYRLYHRAFLLKNRSKQTVRGKLRRLGDLLLPRRKPHLHIEAPPQASATRDRVVWDPLSDQPHQHASRLEKLLVRLHDTPAHLEAAAASARALAPAVRRYRELRAGLYRQPVAVTGLGVALRPFRRDPQALLAALEQLGVEHVLLRLHPWDREHDSEAELARELHRRGHDVGFALPQNRALVKDPERWQAAVGAIARRFAPFGRSFQIGQAVNRSKWGVWNAREYAELFAAARRIILAERPDAQLLGPAVIDFEPHVTAALLNLDHPGLELDAVASLLYVDRRGAPEQRQLGLDAVGKLVAIKALAETSRNCKSGRSWITEMNWPLREGPHSPAGRDVAVSEESQASFLVRYYVLALTSGLVERVYWWQLIARGYGLIEPLERGLRTRPSYTALQQLTRELGGATSLGPLKVPEPARLFRFCTASGITRLVGWSAGDAGIEVELPGEPVRISGRDGAPLPTSAGRKATLLPTPAYFDLESAGER